MLNLPPFIMALFAPFRSLFQQRTWAKAQLLVLGAILVIGKRTVTSALRVMGLSDEPQFAKYHHVLNRAAWSAHQAAQVLLQLLLQHLTLDKESPLVFGIDESIERRWISLMWLSKIPWAQRVWALPFLTVLAPSERYFQDRGRKSKKVTDWARQMILQLRRWLPERQLVVVADYTYATLALLHACQRLAHPVTLITRLRLDAALYKPAALYGGQGRPRKKGAALPTLGRVLEDRQTIWQPAELHWYDGQVRRMEFTTATAVWYHSGMAPVPLRWVLVRDPQGHYAPIRALIHEPGALCPADC